MAHNLLKSKNVTQNLNQKMMFSHTFYRRSGNSPFSQHHHQKFQARKHKGPVSCQEKVPIFFSSWRSESVKAQKEFNSKQNFDDSEVLDHPGGKIKFTSKLDFLPETQQEKIYCYRVLDDNGLVASGNFTQITKEVAVKMYIDMATLQTMDTIFYEAQRQGRISFYVPSIGEEAINIASAAALQMNDFVFPQAWRCIIRETQENMDIRYREPGVLLWRGFTLQEFANQCFGNKNDNGKGRQMPAHYGSKHHNYFTIASTIATQISHAVGAAYSLKMDQKNACTITYFGDGGTSTGDFHAAMNFAAVLEVPVIFFCRNNGWAISTPLREQFRSDGIVTKGQAYGIRSIRIDGNDTLAIYSAVHAARQMAIREQRPILIEALTYRAGHHTTSDDSTKYRSADETQRWKMEKNPVTRFKKWIEREGWWNGESEEELRSSLRKQVLNAIQVAENEKKPQIDEIFTDVYDSPPSNLREQEMFLRQAMKRQPQNYPPDFSL